MQWGRCWKGQVTAKYAHKIKVNCKIVPNESHGIRCFRVPKNVSYLQWVQGYSHTNDSTKHEGTLMRSHLQSKCGLGFLLAFLQNTKRFLSHTHSHDPTWATHVISSSGVQSMYYKDLNYINGIPCVTCALCTITLKIKITCICQKLPVWPKWNGQLFGLAYIVLWHTFACPNSCSMTSVTGKHTHTLTQPHICMCRDMVCVCVSVHLSASYIYTTLPDQAFTFAILHLNERRK